MSEVKRYWLPSSLLKDEAGWHQDDTCVVPDWAYDALAAQRDEGLAREAELRAQIAELQQTGGPHFCSLPMSKNPHPEAGIPGRYLEVGAVSECIPCLVASRHSWAKTAETLQQRLAEAEKKLDPVDGDLLPAVGSKVFIHLARSDSWAEHTVVGYYAWDNHGLDKNVHRVFVRVRDSQGYLNARLLNDIRLASPGCADGEKAQ
jgi:hypothetical protein